MVLAHPNRSEALIVQEAVAHNEGLGRSGGEVQDWMRENQPRLLVPGGKYGLSFEPTEPGAYRRYVPMAEIHILDAEHFALGTAADQIAQLLRAFVRQDLSIPSSNIASPGRVVSVCGARLSQMSPHIHL